jgi:ribosome recycling factor
MNKINKEEKDKEIKKQRKNDLYKEIQKVKNDLINVETKELLSDKKYHEWILKYIFNAYIVISIYI